MSDFDREAEREKLREQFERDEEKRQASERMSELLLKGATMTNKHCDVCGDPIFRHEGQEFCPSCHGPGGQAQQRAADAQGQSARQQPTEAGNGTPEDPQPDPTDVARAATETPDPDADPVVEQPPEGAGPEARDEAPTPDPRREADVPAVAGDSEDVSEARASLGRSLTALARQAEATDDLSRTREYLAAAREAAEALEAAERVGR